MYTNVKTRGFFVHDYLKLNYTIVFLEKKCHINLQYEVLTVKAVVPSVTTYLQQ